MPFPFTFTPEVVSTTGGQQSKVVVNPLNSVPAIAYRENTGQLTYAEKIGVVWVKTTLDITLTNVILPSLAFKSNGDVGIAYGDNTTFDIRYIERVSGTWSVSELLSSSPIGDSSLSYDSADKPHVLFSVPPLDTFRYTNKISGTWSTVEDVLTGADLILNADSIGGFGVNMVNGELSMTYYDPPNTNLMRAYKPFGGVWVTEILHGAVPAVISGNSSDLIYNSSGDLFVAFNFEQAQLTHIIKKPLGLSWITLAQESTDSNATRDIAITLDNGGIPLVASMKWDPSIGVSAGISFDRFSGNTTYEHQLLNGTGVGRAGVAITPGYRTYVSYYTAGVVVSSTTTNNTTTPPSFGFTVSSTFIILPNGSPSIISPDNPPMRGIS